MDIELSVAIGREPLSLPPQQALTRGEPIVVKRKSLSWKTFEDVAQGEAFRHEPDFIPRE